MVVVAVPASVGCETGQAMSQRTPGTGVIALQPWQSVVTVWVAV